MSATIIRFGDAVMALGRTDKGETRAVMGNEPFPIANHPEPPMDPRYAAALKAQREAKGKK
jgi:hypothetical protein